MCLLDRPFHSHFMPKPSARSAVAVPQVATPLGPTSQPGGLSVCTRCPGRVVGPVKASALAVALARRLRESARPGDVALTDIDPVARDMPLRTLGHRTPPSDLRPHRPAHGRARLLRAGLPSGLYGALRARLSRL